jgi:acetyl-CoA synthetase
MTANTDRYRAAGNQLVDLIGGYDKAVETFAWPQHAGGRPIETGHPYEDLVDR